MASAILRLVNGADLLVKLSVGDTIAALRISADGDAFVELPGEGGPVHVRPATVIAIVEGSDHKTSGFRPR